MNITLFITDLAWPFFLFTFIPIIFIKTGLIQRTCNTYSFRKLLFFNAMSTGISTLLGVSIALYVLQHVSTTCIEFSPFFAPIIIVLSLSFFVSALCECLVLSKLLNAYYKCPLIVKEVIKANIVSYSYLLGLILLCFASINFFIALMPKS